ncbi:MAG: CCA tRNA nucleotidyltransferase [Actinomycetota bacterium]|nr:CCA tRNA nucleotidyltransferase [Acidimicrobiales bacterium]MEC7777962.1 CCA tRNA nucleotidyltransferase [Actinomycetota bacterium]MDG2904896.1 CCA tRNA nucleotidyltransferase [Acidimicrobiales bacterium]MEC8815035.1 CCA tRNA nucleotidyltransferase [Actinomycetota bacterium]MEC8920943.1 CCA tRNA nucleotidyltransferase [Actinomycetota bacterium]
MSALDGPVPVGIFDDLCAAVSPVADRFLANGFRFYLVGGVVRDRLLGVDRTPDLDLTTDAPPERIRELVDGVADTVWLQGERFGTVGIRLGDLTMEITTHRAEAYMGDSRKPVVRFSTDLHEDLVRRDFTVNAMAVEVVERTLHDPYDGRADLGRGILKTPLPPEESFSDDPLRMLRAARFVARYALVPAEGLVGAAQSLVGRMAIVSAERIRDELFRLLEVEDPSTGVHLLEEIGLLDVLLPEVAALGAGVRNRALEVVATATDDPVLRLAVLAQSAGGMASRLVDLRLSGTDIRRIAVLVDGADRIVEGSTDGPWSDEQVRRLAVAVGPSLDPVLDFVDLVGVETGDLVAVVERLGLVGELDDLGPALDGDAIMVLLDLPAGPEVGEALSWLVDLRLREGRVAPDEAATRLADWWSSRAAG